MGMLASLFGEGTLLLNPFKPLLLLAVIAPWALVISKVYDKHAARFHLARRSWNALHLAVGLAAVAAFFLVAIPLRNEGGFWAGLGTLILLLVGDLVAYPMVANKDDRVPERHRITLDFSKWKEAVAQKKAAKEQATVELQILAPDKSVLNPPPKESPEYEVRVAAETLYIKALVARASQQDIAPAGKDGAYAVTNLVDGVRQPVETLPAPNALKIMDFWKSAGKLDVNDRRRKLIAPIIVKRGDLSTPVRVTSIGASGGMRVTLQFDMENAVKRKPEDLGLLPQQFDALKTINAEPGGVVLLAAPPKGGRTTTLYSLVRMHDAYTSNVQTFEVDPQAALEGVRSNTFNPSGDAEFSTTLRSILRRDPDVVAVAELPDAASAQEIARADLARTRVYLSLRGDNALAAIQTYVKAVGDPKLVAASLRGVAAQKLVRKLCTNCRVPYKPSPEMLKKLGLPEDKVQQLFKKGGQVLIKNKPEVCPMCQGVGYLGQEALFELFPIGPEEQDAIANNNLQALRSLWRKRQLPSIQQVAIRKAVEGLTSIEEISRAAPSAPQASPSSPAETANA